jgi:hypothetical protein
MFAWFDVQVPNLEHHNLFFDEDIDTHVLPPSQHAFCGDSFSNILNCDWNSPYTCGDQIAGPDREID